MESTERKPETTKKIEASVSETHLEFIQNTITRMGQNSFQAKEWCITIDSALLAFELANGQNSAGKASIVIAIVVTALFCLLDTYYLYLERGYRALYSMAAQIEERDSSFKEYIMTIPKSQRGFKKYIRSLLRFVTGVFYLIIISGLVIVMFFVKEKTNGT